MTAMTSALSALSRPSMTIRRPMVRKSAGATLENTDTF